MEEKVKEEEENQDKNKIKTSKTNTHSKEKREKTRRVGFNEVLNGLIYAGKVEILTVGRLT